MNAREDKGATKPDGAGIGMRHSPHRHSVRTRVTLPSSGRSFPAACHFIYFSLYFLSTSSSSIQISQKASMFSNSNSYLGGGGGLRPGAPQYGQGQGQYGAQQPGQQQQPQQFAPQPTGYGMQPQMTGYPSQPLQQQYTAMPSQPSQFQQQQPQPTGFQSFQPQPTGFPQQQQAPQQQPQQTSFQQNLQPPSQPQAPRQQPQPTGLTSSQMASSFRAPSTSQPTPSFEQPKQSNKIPSIRLSFITATDQAKFEQLFKSAVGTSQALSGDQARELLLRSNLPGDKLSDIW